MPRRYFHRHQAKPGGAVWVKAGLGAALGICMIAWLGQTLSVPLLIAPLGASSVLVFAVPESPLSQPANVVGGHTLAVVASLVLRTLLPEAWWAAGVAVGVVIALMAVARLTHPPAGADPLVAFLGASAADDFAVAAIAGSLMLVIAAVMVHRLPPRTVVYPLPIGLGEQEG